MNIETRLAP